jgi:putative PIN family toxin of toxin-antitoxin system
MKIVLDTNVYLSYFVFGGRVSEMVEHCSIENQTFRSPFIQDEILEKLSQKFRFSDERLDAVREILIQQTTLVIPTNSLPTACRDADDNPILQLAEFIQAEYLVTGDRDLLVLNSFGETRIVSPQAAFEAFGLGGTA